MVKSKNYAITVYFRWAVLAILLPFQVLLYGQDTVDSIPRDTGTVIITPPDTVIPDAVNERHQFSLQSPYHTIVSHLYFLQPDSYYPDSAAMTLYMENPISDKGRDLAIKLKQFLDGSGYFIDIEDIPQDPFFLDSTTKKHKYFPVPEVSSIFVYKKKDNWYYSQTTVMAIPKLFKSVYPLGTLDWLPAWSKGKFAGLKLWQYIGFIILILLTYVLQKLLTYLIGQILDKLLTRLIKKQSTTKFFYNIARPISYLILFYIILKLVPNLQLPIGLNKWLLLGIRVMIPVFYMLITMQAVNVLVAYFQRKAAKTESKLDDQLIPLVRNLAKSVVVIFFVMYILNMLKVDITAMIGGVAFGSLAFALAAQDTVKNLFGSLIIFVDRPFQIGDWIQVAGQDGVVEEISLRYTRIRTFANSVVTIPNGTIGSGIINNLGMRKYRRFVTHVGITYETPPHLVATYVEGIKQIVLAHPLTRKDVYEVHFEEMGDSSLKILVYVFFEVPTWTEELQCKQQLLIAIMGLAEELGISFAFPTQTLHIDSFPEKKSSMLTHERKPEDYKKQVSKFLDKWKTEIHNEKKDDSTKKSWGSDMETDDGSEDEGGK